MTAFLITAGAEAPRLVAPIAALGGLSLHIGSCWVVPFAGTARQLYSQLRSAAGCPVSGVVIAEITGEYLQN